MVYNMVYICYFSSLLDKDLHPYMGTQGVLLSSTGDSAFPHPSAYIDRRDRRASTDYASEGSSATSHSVSSSAASSSVHLPMDGMAIHQHYVRVIPT